MLFCFDINLMSCAPNTTEANALMMMPVVVKKFLVPLLNMPPKSSENKLNRGHLVLFCRYLEQHVYPLSLSSSLWSISSAAWELKVLLSIFKI